MHFLKKSDHFLFDPGQSVLSGREAEPFAVDALLNTVFALAVVSDAAAGAEGVSFGTLSGGADVLPLL